MPTPTDGGEPDGIDPMDFETAQRRLLAASGVDATVRSVALAEPPVRTQVLEAGSDDGGPPLVLVHGTGSFGAFFAPLLAHLGGVRTIAFDRPGYGGSDPFEYTGADVPGAVVAAVESVLDALDLDRVDLVCHSMGANAGLRLALAHPERVRRLVLLGAVPGLPGTAPPIPIRILTTPVLNRLLLWLQHSGEEGVRDVAAIFGEREAIEDHPAFVRALAAHEAVPAASRAGFSEYRAVASPVGWRRSIRLGEARLRQLAVPTTVVWGGHDPLGDPAECEAAIEAIPAVRLEVVDAGHIPFLAQAARCAELVRAARRH